MKIRLMITLFLCSFSSVFAGDFVCKAIQKDIGSYTLIELLDNKKHPTGHFDVQYEGTDGSVKKTLAKNARLETMSKIAEDSGYAYEIYLDASEAYPERKRVRYEDVGHFSRVIVGPRDEAKAVLMFWLDASGKIIDMFGENGDESFLCEENEKNPITLPEAPRVG